MKIDFHIHSAHSPDSLITGGLLHKICTKHDITPVISDHNRIAFAQHYKRKYGNAIVAEEVKTEEGDIICLFATEHIKPDLSVAETVDRIREQGALVYVPHPFDVFRSTSIRKIFFKPDIVEVFNGRVLNQAYNKKALQFADDNKTLKAVGSDSHLHWELAKTYVEMEDFNSIKEFKRNLAKGRAVVRSSGYYVMPLTTAVYKFRTKVLGHRKYSEIP